MPLHLIVFITLFALSVGYAFLLNYLDNTWPELFDQHNWVTVVFGVGYTIFALFFLLESDQLWLVFLAFSISGGPIVGRSLINELVRKKSLNDILNKSEEEDDDQK